MNNTNVRWTEFVCHWPLWSVYLAHFSMNWSNYIIMQWLPTYLTRSLGASNSHIMFTAVPYIMNSLVGVGMYALFLSWFLPFFNAVINFLILWQEISQFLQLRRERFVISFITLSCHHLMGKTKVFGSFKLYLEA